MKLTQRGTAGLAALSIVIALLAMGHPAYAAGCSGGGCNGKDAGAMGCAGGSTYTVYTRDVDYRSGNLSATMRVFLRYSPACGTNWARVDVVASSPSNYAFQISLTLKDQNYNTIGGTSYGAVGRSAYGHMYYAPSQPVRACGTLDTFSGGYQCTAAG